MNVYIVNKKQSYEFPIYYINTPEGLCFAHSDLMWTESSYRSIDEMLYGYKTSDYTIVCKELTEFPDIFCTAVYELLLML